MSAPERIWATGAGKDPASHWWHSGTVAGADEYILVTAHEAAVAAAQQREAGLTDAVERLVVVLDRNDKKGPIPDVEMMFCWLAAQDIRAAFRAALSHNGRKGE